MSATKKSIRLIVESIARSQVKLDLGGREVVLPRTALPTSLAEGDIVRFDVTVEASTATREEIAAHVDEQTSRRVGTRKRGNPRSASTRGSKK